MPSNLALQLYTVREQLDQDFAGTIRKIAQMGYTGVETAGLFGGSPTSAAKLFADLGLTICGAHSGLPLGDQKQAVIDTLGALNCKRLILPWYAPESFQTEDGIKQVADLLNEGAAVAQAHGFTVGYHNHWFEYGLVNGRLATDILLEYLAPPVFLEVDVYWVKTAGHDPVEMVRRLGHRAPLLHIKDGPCVMEAPMTALGEGVMDIPGIVAASAGTAEWLVVELDHCATDMLEAVQKSIQYLKPMD